MSRIWHLTTLWLVGSMAVALVTWGCFRFGVGNAATELAYLLVIVVASLFDSAISSIVLSIVAVLCLDYYFTEPIYSFEIASWYDAFMLAVFVFTSSARPRILISSSLPIFTTLPIAASVETSRMIASTTSPTWLKHLVCSPDPKTVIASPARAWRTESR